MMTQDPNYKLAIVGLDLTEMDDYIINYIPTLLNGLPLERVIFVHIARQLELPEDIIEKYPDLIAPLDESIESDLRRKIEPVFEGKNIRYDILVQEGQPLERFLKICRIKDADLIVMGRKHKLQGSGVLAGDVVRKSHTSMLFITERFDLKLDKILIPSDFSKHTAQSIVLANTFKERIGASLELIHIYQVPNGYSKIGKSYDEFSELLKYHAEDEFKKFCKINDLSEEISCVCLDLENHSEAKFIIDYAHNSRTDLILIGSRGRTNTSALLLGSMAEKIVFEDNDIPVLVVKNKGENLGFFEALMKL